MSDEQPRKKVRLTGPEGSISASLPEVDAAVAAQLEQEKSAGITVFASQAAGFGGVVKKRYTDFLVNEISTDGTVFHLDELTGPAVKAVNKVEKDVQAEEEKEKAAEPVKAEPAPVKEDAPKPDNAELAVKERMEEAIASIASADVDTLKTIFGEKTTTDICNLYAKSIARPERKTRDHGSLQSDVIEDKQMRTDAHINVRRIFGGRVDTMTNDDNTIAIKIAAQANKINARALPGSKGKNARPKGKVGWEELGGEHLHFTLYKENKDTMEVLYWIASQLKLHVKNFQFAGTKDRRGVTVQRVSAYRIAADRLQGINSTLRQARLGGFKYMPQGLDLGDLYGNEFTITLRDCTFPGQQGDAAAQLENAKKITHDAVSQFQERGFINYYGLQRFGTFAISTDTIGRKMLRGDLESAVQDILSFSPEALAAASNPDQASTKISHDDIARAEALHIWQTTKKSGAALDKLPRRFQAENALIRHLGWVDRKSGELLRAKDWQGALQNIPRNLRLMYVHAYQSLVWNTVAGRRYQLYGNKVVAGDLVLVHEHKDKEAYNAHQDEETIDDCGEIIVRPAAHDTATSLEDKFERARALTPEEASSGKYTIFDLVLPLPGFDVMYPSNDLGACYTEYMGSDQGGNLNPKDMRRKWRDISLSGSYRKLTAKPQGLAWEVKPYFLDEEQLVQTDLDKLIAKAKEQGNADALGGAKALLGSDKSLEKSLDGQTADADVAMTGDDSKTSTTDAQQQQQQKLAVVINMQLGSSQYATMALRELTKGGAVAFRPDFQGGRIDLKTE
ncbi:tRNA pseudouridine synthase D [Aureobasidium sp. EXF-10728]|nr:tRNA pseudouridine synthase D [Aureobasidium sp. EXF-10728]